MACITLFPASNCTLSVSPSRKEEREKPWNSYAHQKMNSTNCAQCYSVCLSFRAILKDTIFNTMLL